MSMTKCLKQINILKKGMKMDPKIIENNFIYHTPKGNQAERYQRLRDEAKVLAKMINVECPDSREKSLAMTKLEEAVFWANASIARNE